MAIMMKIRKQSTLLLITVGVAMLFFVLGEQFLFDIFTPESAKADTIGEIDGEEISTAYFRYRVDQAKKKQSALYQNTNLKSEDVDRIQQMEWNNLIQEKLIFARANDLGCIVSEDEMSNLYLGPNPHPLVRQNFGDPQTGKVDRSVIQNAIARAEQDANINMQLMFLKNEVRKDRKRTKYFNLIKKGIFVTKLEAERDHLDNQRKVNIEFVGQTYGEIDDSEVNYTDDDLQAYYSEHKNEARFQQDVAERSVEYISFDVIPTAEDKQSLEQELIDIKDIFEATDDDTLFVQNHTDIVENPKLPPLYYYRSGDIPEAEFFIAGHDSNAVFGPFYSADDNSYKLLKVIKTRTAADSARINQMFLAYADQDTTEVNDRADSLKNVVESGGDFINLAQTFSADKTIDGGWIADEDPRIMKKLLRFLFEEGDTGDVLMVDDPQNRGKILFQLSDRTPSRTKKLVGIVTNLIEPSDVTYDNVLAKATEYYLANQTEEKFNETKNSKGVRLATGIQEGQKELSGLGEAPEIIRWVFNNEKGSISSPFRLGARYIVVHISSVREKGQLPLEAVEDEILVEVLNQKKAEVIKSKMSGADLPAVAQSLGKSVQTAQNVYLKTFNISGIGVDKKVLGVIFALPQDQVSKAIEGETGVYMVKVASVQEPEEVNIQMQKMRLAQTMNTRVEREAYSAILDAADIVDKRYLIY